MPTLYTENTTCIFLQGVEQDSAREGWAADADAAARAAAAGAIRSYCSFLGHRLIEIPGVRGWEHQSGN